MHEIIVTEGVVLNKRPVGEANTLVAILTRDLGLVRAKALSTRREGSKLRYGLEPLTVGRFSLVRGKQEWRLTGVEQVSRSLAACPHNGGRKRVAQVASLLLRLMPGAEPTPLLFKTVIQGFEIFAQTSDQLSLDSIEVVLVLRILAHLGYLPETPALAPYVDGALTVELSAQALRDRSLLIKTINESLQATGL